MAARPTKAQRKAEADLYAATCHRIAMAMARSENVDRTWWQAINTADTLKTKGKLSDKFLCAIGDFASGAREAVLCARHVQHHGAKPFEIRPVGLGVWDDEELP